MRRDGQAGRLTVCGADRSLIGVEPHLQPIAVNPAMLEIWFSVGYVLLLAIVLFALILWRTGGAVPAIAALVIGLPLWFGWEYARPTWTTGTIIGTEVRRSDPDAGGNTRDVQYIYMRTTADKGLEIENEDSWWWFKRNSERVFNDAITAEDRKTAVTVLWYRWRSQLLSWHPNVLAIRPAGDWWSWRAMFFYLLSLPLWAAYFYGFSRLNRRSGR
jgi:hypothetical protein